MRTRLLVVLLLLALAACGERVVVDDPTAGEAMPSPSADLPVYQVEVAAPDFDDPLPVVLRLPGGTSHELEPWTYCLTSGLGSGGCSDGTWPSQPFDVGSPEWVDFTFGLPGWDFDATFNEPRSVEAPEPVRSVAARVEPRGDHTFRVFPAGGAGPWHVDVFGRGEGGDVIVTFAWTTSRDGDFPGSASAQAAVLADDDGALTSYGVELGLSDLDRTPRQARARIEVISDNGRRTTLDLGAQTRPWSVGSVSWRAGEATGRRAAALGGERFTYRVTVVLDGRTYVGTAVWPDDTNEEITPGVPLTFTPPLPGYSSDSDR